MPARLFHEASNLPGFFDIYGCLRRTAVKKRKKKDQKAAKVIRGGIKREGGLEYGIGQYMCNTNSRLCLVLMGSLTPPMVAKLGGPEHDDFHRPGQLPCGRYVQSAAWLYSHLQDRWLRAERRLPPLPRGVSRRLYVLSC